MFQPAPSTQMPKRAREHRWSEYNSVMRFVLLALKIAAAFIVAVIACMGAILLYAFALPSASVDVPVPLAGVAVRFEAWSGVADETFWLVVQTPRGATKRRLWSNWGPATRVNFYRTPDEWLVVLGGGGDSEMVDVNDPKAGEDVFKPRVSSSDSATWTYLGAVDRPRREPKARRFFSPAELRECFAMFGAGYSPYRVSRQAESRCD